MANSDPGKSLPDWLPFVGGALLVLQFAGLGVWQVSRGLEKLETRDAFGEPALYADFFDGAEVRPYQAVKATGRYDGDRQFLLDNIVLEGRYGWYVVTPLILADDEPVLLVNRGWLEKPPLAAAGDAVVPILDVPQGPVTVRGRVGSLPRPGMRMGDPLAGATGWPKTAVFPRFTDIAAALGQEVQPFVLLLDPEEAAGFVRYWAPEELSAGKHFGYALQWFAMGAVLAGLLAWHLRRRRADQGARTGG